MLSKTQAKVVRRVATTRVVIMLCVVIGAGLCGCRATPASTGHGEVDSAVYVRVSDNKEEPMCLLCCWSDGLVAWGRTDERLGGFVWATHVNERKAKEVLESIRFLENQHKRLNYSVPGSADCELTVRKSGIERVAIWDEVIYPGWGPNTAASKEYVEFACKWQQAVIKLCSICHLASARIIVAEDMPELFARTGCKNINELLSSGWWRNQPKLVVN